MSRVSFRLALDLNLLSTQEVSKTFSCWFPSVQVVDLVSLAICPYGFTVSRSPKRCLWFHRGNFYAYHGVKKKPRIRE